MRRILSVLVLMTLLQTAKAQLPAGIGLQVDWAGVRSSLYLAAPPIGTTSDTFVCLRRADSVVTIMSIANFRTFLNSGFVQYTDTSSMLSNYMRKGYGVLYTDTTGMLSKLLRKTDTSTMLSGLIRKGYAILYTDSTSMLSNLLRKTDTATMLSPYAQKVKYVPYIGAVNDLNLNNKSIVTTGNVSANFFNVNNGVGQNNIVSASTTASKGDTIPDKAGTFALLSDVTGDTTTGLAPYLRKSDTATMLSNRLKISDTATMLSKYGGMYKSNTWNQRNNYNGIEDFTNSANVFMPQTAATTNQNYPFYVRDISTSALRTTEGTNAVYFNPSSGVFTVGTVNAYDGVSAFSSYLNGNGLMFYNNTFQLQTRARNLGGNRNVYFQDKDYTLGDSAAIALKLNISDTASMLSHYERNGFGVKYTDTAAMLSHYYNQAASDARYGQLANVNTWSGTNTFNSTLVVGAGGLLGMAASSYILTGDSATGVNIKNAGNLSNFWVQGNGNTLTRGTATITGLASGSAGNFVVNGGSGLLVTRTAAQTLSDIGALSTSVAASTYLPLAAGPSYPLSGQLYTNNQAVFVQNTVGTNYSTARFSNTGGNTYIGNESSIGATFFTGATAYSTYFGTDANRSLHLATNNTVRYTIDGSGNNTWAGTGTIPNLILSASIPSIAAGTGAGTSPTISIAGTNQSFTVQLTVGTLPATSSTIWTVTFSNSFTFPSAARATFSPANSAAALLSGTSMVFVSPGNTAATILMTAGTVALPAGTYIWNVNVLGN